MSYKAINLFAARVIMMKVSPTVKARKALAISRSALQSLMGFRHVGDRIISARFQTTVGHITSIQVYAPTAEAKDAVINRCYDELQTEVHSTKRMTFKLSRGILMQKSALGTGLQAASWEDTA